MTKHKNQVGQDGAGVNGGEFAKKTQTPDTVTLAAPVRVLDASLARNLRDAARTAKLMRDAAEDAQARLSILFAKDELRAQFPTAVRAYVHKTDESDSTWGIFRVVDAQGESVFEYWQDWEKVRAVDELVGGIEGYWYFDQDADDEVVNSADDSAGEYLQMLDLTDIATDEDIPKVDDLLGLTGLSRMEQDDLLGRVAGITGETTVCSGKTEFEYLLTNDASSVDADDSTIATLDEKFGGREEALEALISTEAYVDFQEQVYDSVYYSLRAANAAAVKEALAS